MSFVYLAEAPSKGILKIGKSCNPFARICALRNSEKCDVKLISVLSGDLSRERLIHEHFENKRSHGEWFFDDPAIRDYFFISIPIQKDSNNHIKLWRKHKIDVFNTTSKKTIMDELIARCTKARTTLAALCISAGLSPTIAYSYINHGAPVPKLSTIGNLERELEKHERAA